MILSEKLGNFMIHLSNWNVGEMKICWEFSCWEGWVVSVFKIIVKVFKAVQNFDGLSSSSMNCNLFVFLVKLRRLCFKIIANFKLWKLFISFKRKLLKGIRLSDFKIWIAVLLKGCKRGCSFVFSHEIDFHQIIKGIILSAEKFDIPFFSPLNDLLISFLSVGSIVQVKPNWVNFYFRINLIEDLNVVSIKIVHFSLKRFYLFIKISKRLYHELDTVWRKIFVLLWIHLFWSEYECRDDFFL